VQKGPSADVVAYVSSYLTPFFILTSIRSKAQARRGEDPDVNPDQFQDPDKEYEADDEEADKIYEQVD
jgi:hypothetical protein